MTNTFTFFQNENTGIVFIFLSDINGPTQFKNIKNRINQHHLISHSSCRSEHNLAGLYVWVSPGCDSDVSGDVASSETQLRKDLLPHPSGCGQDIPPLWLQDRGLQLLASEQLAFSRAASLLANGAL